MTFANCATKFLLGEVISPCDGSGGFIFDDFLFISSGGLSEINPTIGYASDSDSDEGETIDGLLETGSDFYASTESGFAIFSINLANPLLPVCVFEDGGLCLDAGRTPSF